MKYVIGIAGLPNAGKSTLIKMLSLADVEIASYPFTTLKPKEVVSFYFPEELEKLHQFTKTEEVRPGALYFLDVPGLIRGAHKGEGLGNEFLSYLRACDAIIEVVRTFKNYKVPHPENTIDPERDLLIIEEEILKAEEKHIENLLNKFKKERNEEKIEILEELKAKIAPFLRFPEYEEKLKEFGFLITKPWYLIFNGEEKIEKPASFVGEFVLDLRYELEVLEKPELLSEFPSKKQEFLNNLRISLDFIQCFTFNEKITQLWLVKKGSTFLDFASEIHSDFAKNFKFAEVLPLEEFVKIKSWGLAQSSGLVKRKGKNDLVEENEIVLIKI